MIAGLYTYAATALVAAALAAAGTWQVQDWRYGEREAERLQAERVADEARQTDARQQRQFADTAAGRHAAVLATLNHQLGDARAHIARLSDRRCLDGGTVRVLNNLGTPGALRLRAPAVQPAGAPPAAATAQADDAAGYASERDTADWIATCRVRHDALAGQLNAILDIEDRRERGQQARPLKP